MKRFWVKKYSWENDFTLCSANVLRETEYYYFLDAYGPHYSKRVDKGQGNKVTHGTAIEAIDYFIGNIISYRDSLQKKIDDENDILRDAIIWARNQKEYVNHV